MIDCDWLEAYGNEGRMKRCKICIKRDECIEKYANPKKMKQIGKDNGKLTLRQRIKRWLKKVNKWIEEMSEIWFERQRNLPYEDDW